MKRKLFTFIIMILCASVITSCSAKSTTTTQAGEASTTTAKPKKFNQLDKPAKGEQIAVVETSMGTIKIRLFPEYAPKAVENFITHAKNGYYDGVIFHRVINDFMIQGGDPSGIGNGGESIWDKDFEDEFTVELHNYRGALSMANSGANTNGSQFFIVQNKDIVNYMDSMISYMEKYPEATQISTQSTDTGVKLKDLYTDSVISLYKKNGGTPHLDYSHTVFGQVFEGMAVVDKIAVVDVNSSDKPLTDVIIESIQIVEYQ